jgi:hypothetical protein
VLWSLRAALERPPLLKELMTDEYCTYVSVCNEDVLRRPRGTACRQAVSWLRLFPENARAPSAQSIASSLFPEAVVTGCTEDPEFNAAQRHLVVSGHMVQGALIALDW